MFKKFQLEMVLSHVSPNSFYNPMINNRLDTLIIKYKHIDTCILNSLGIDNPYVSHDYLMTSTGGPPEEKHLSDLSVAE